MEEKISKKDLAIMACYNPELIKEKIQEGKLTEEKDLVTIFNCSIAIKEFVLEELKQREGRLENWVEIYKDNKSLIIRRICLQKISGWNENRLNESFERLIKIYLQFNSNFAIHKIIGIKILALPPLGINFLVDKNDVYFQPKLNYILSEKIKQELKVITDKKILKSAINNPRATTAMKNRFKKRISEL